MTQGMESPVSWVVRPAFAGLDAETAPERLLRAADDFLMGIRHALLAWARARIARCAFDPAGAHGSRVGRRDAARPFVGTSP